MRIRSADWEKGWVIFIMKKVLLIGTFDSAVKEIGDCLAGQFQVQPCAEEEEAMQGMLQTGTFDWIVISLSGSAIAARQKFTVLRQSKIPLLGIGDASQETELFISGFLSESDVRFLRRPASPTDVTRCAKELGVWEEDKAGTGSGAGTGTGTILLVDDSPEFLRTMEAMLSDTYKVAFATSGAQALVAIGKSKPDLILLDYEMPVCDGKMTLEMIRSEEDMKDIPVIFLTGISDARHVRAVKRLHPQGYLLKPCSKEMLLSAIEKVLRKKK